MKKRHRYGPFKNMWHEQQQQPDAATASASTCGYSFNSTGVFYSNNISNNISNIWLEAAGVTSTCGKSRLQQHPMSTTF